MNSTELDKKWLTRKNSHLKKLGDFIVSSDEYDVPQLENYVQTGVARTSTRKPIKSRTGHVSPPIADWESAFLLGALARHGSAFLKKFESNSVRNGILDKESLAEAYCYLYYSYLGELYGVALDSHRFPNRASPRKLGMEIVPFVCLGFVCGMEDKFLPLAKASLILHQNKRFIYDKYPVFVFCLALLRDYLNDPTPLEFDFRNSEAQFLEDLLGNWQTNDLALLESLCIHVLNYHTHRCSEDDDADGDGEWYEFSNGEWWYIAFEILLVFWMRQKEGLQNPVIEHPLMASCMGEIPSPLTFKSSALVERVLERMQTQGFDEKLVIETILA